MTVERVIKSQIDWLNRRISDCRGNMRDAVEYYCDADNVRANTAIINVCNVVNHASEIKSYKRAIDALENVLAQLELCDSIKEEA